MYILTYLYLLEKSLCTSGLSYNLEVLMFSNYFEHGKSILVGVANDYYLILNISN